MIELTHRFGRYGYRRISALLRDAGWQVNDKRVERLWRREGLTIRVKRKLNSTEVINALTDLFILRGVPAYVRSDNVLYAELLAGLASGHYRIEVSRHVHSMAQFGFLVNDSLSHNKHKVRFCGSHRP